MKISAVFNQEGHIIAAQEVKSAAAGSAAVHLLAGPGELQDEFDAPSHHSAKAFTDVAHLLRVDVATRRLVDK